MYDRLAEELDTTTDDPEFDTNFLDVLIPQSIVEQIRKDAIEEYLQSATEKEDGRDWAYDAVSTLAADGVIDGYPDGTYQGQNTMTRYEMAQIVARAMAKTDLEKADKALVDKLAAEFADELDNLGVRVADLEKKSDNVVWKGELRYRYVDGSSDAVSKITGKKYNDNDTSQVMFRLEPKAYIGDTGWTANVRVDYEMKADEDANGKTVVARAYAKGPIGHNTTVTAGRIPLLDTYAS